MKISLVFSLLMSLAFSALAVNESDAVRDAKFRIAVQNVTGMGGWDRKSEAAREIARRAGLDINTVTWEDTARDMGSSMGANISDSSIQVRYKDEGGNEQLASIPVIRTPNFSDVTADISPSNFFLLVGNEKGAEGEELEKITLTELLGNLPKYLSNPRSLGEGSDTNLLKPRDTKVLVSAQHAILPVPEGQVATFTPNLFNYQSSEGNAAVLTIVASRLGTSVQIIQNKNPDGERMSKSFLRSNGQALYFNKNGERAPYTGERKSDVEKRGEELNPDESVGANDLEGANMVMIIQVPLKHKVPPRRMYMPMMAAGLESFSMRSLSRSAAPDMEEAVIGHGKVEGPFIEIDGQKMERDGDYPVRVTVQFYQASKTGEFTPDIAAKMKSEIDAVYKNAAAVGSLVTGSQARVTAHDKHWRPVWWIPYPIFIIGQIHLNDFEVVERLEAKFGPEWHLYVGSMNRVRESVALAMDVKLEPSESSDSCSKLF